MSELEIFSVVLSFILGLGVAQILSSIVYIVHARRETLFGWTPLLWAAAILLFHVNFLFASFWFYSNSESFEWYWLDLASAVLLFLSGGLVLPSESRPVPEHLEAFFERDGKLALLPLGIFLAASVPYNVLGGLPLVGPDNLILACLFVFAAMAYVMKGRFRAWATVAFATLTAYGFFFLWARPGFAPG